MLTRYGSASRRGDRLPCARSLAVALLLLAAAACAPKIITPPSPAVLRFPDFVFPAARPGLGTPATLDQHVAGWNWLQAGDLRAAERSFAAALKLTRDFYPAEAGLGYTSLARHDEEGALLHFDRAVVANPGYAPALAGRGDALLASGKPVDALVSFEAAVAADPSLSALTGRIDVLRFRRLQDDVAVARQAAEAKRWPEARQAYLRAIAASPQSPFLHRELAFVERDGGDGAAALAHARRAVDLDTADARSLILIGELLEARGAADAALESFAAALALEPDAALEARIARLRASAALAAMPLEYQAIESAASLTRAQLAALIGVRLESLLNRAGNRSAVVMTDTRGNWAAPWILAVARSGIMEVYANHTFQPTAPVRRVDLALAASRVLALVADQQPPLAASWQSRGEPRRFPDLAPGSPSYPAVSLVVAAGVMAPVDDGTFQATRTATGAEAVAAISRLAELALARAR